MAFWRAASRTARSAESGFSIRHPYPQLANLNFSADTFDSSSPRRMTCGELRTKHVGSLVELAGSLQEKRLGRFLLLRDAYGSTQLVIPDETMVTGQVEVSIQNLVMVRVNRGVYSKNCREVKGKVLKSQTRNYSTYAPTKSLTTEETTKCKGNSSLLWQMQNRTETCADFTLDDVGRKIVLIGWIHSHHLPRFIKLKDGHGTIQCLIPSAKGELQDVLKNISADELLQINGSVMARPKSQINLQEESGEIEILVDAIGKLDPSVPVPSLEEKEVETPEFNENGVNSHTSRTHTCGELGIANVGQQIVLCGWLEHCRLNKFFTLRDSYGVTQCILSDENVKSHSINSIPLESTLEVKGNVGARPPGSVNENMPTGEIEVLVSELKVLNPAIYTPFQVRSFQKPKEQLQLLNRFIYLRYPEMQHNLRTRSTMLMKMRKFLVDSNEFVEVETPTLFCRTPGGAKEFIVPTRHKGQFYSLIQSPQQHKQMLMAGGIDRYFQIARCYRDEMTRGDRQPEFTQLDIEMSFANRDNILSLTEDLVRSFWPHPLPSAPFTRLTYHEALTKYGSDKPDVSFGLQLRRITDQLLINENLKNNMENFEGFAIVLKSPTNYLSNSFKKLLNQSSKERFPTIKFIMTPIKNSLEEWYTSVNILGRNVSESLANSLQLSVGDILFLAYGPMEDACCCLGEIRLKLAKEAEANGQLQKSTNESPLWVVDFPMFVKGQDGQLESCHHPFTAPNPEDQHLLKLDPLNVRSLAYDLVIAGAEVGGGSVRIHDSQLQKTVLEMLKISHVPLQHLINALESGCPPHAGIALGVDRLVAIACNAETIREVIAFPKTHEGRDPLSGAPSSLTPEEQTLYHIQVPDSEDSPPKRLRSNVSTSNERIESSKINI